MLPVSKSADDHYSRRQHPHRRDRRSATFGNLYREKVPGAIFVAMVSEAGGLTQVDEMGEMERQSC